MNDGSETTYGIDVFSFFLERFMVRKPDNEKEFAGRVLKAVQDSIGWYKTGIFCLSSEPNLLNQWRDYGKETVSYRIQFDTLELIKKSNFNFEVSVWQMIYSQAPQKSMMRQLIKSIYDTVKSLDDSHTSSDDQIAFLILSATTEIMWMNLHFKNPAFAAEKEWRLSATIDSILRSTKLEFRS